MKCPLLRIQWRGIPGDQKAEWADCLKEECAWWDNEGEACSILGLNLELIAISETLGEIALKMPHEEQFRR